MKRGIFILGIIFLSLLVTFVSAEELTCVDFDGDEDNYFLSGNVTVGNATTGTLTVSDYCLYKLLDLANEHEFYQNMINMMIDKRVFESSQLDDNKLLIESYCPLGVLSNLSNPFVFQHSYSCQYGCVEGACIEEPTVETCEDNDPNQDLNILGICNGIEGEYQDYCIPYSGDQDKVVQYFCNGENKCVSVDSVECALGFMCEEGACVEEPDYKSICNDSDDGKDYYVKGSVNWNGTLYEDECSRYGTNYLKEYVCMFNTKKEFMAMYFGYFCPDGCENGVCIIGGNISKGTKNLVGKHSFVVNDDWKKIFALTSVAINSEIDETTNFPLVILDGGVLNPASEKFLVEYDGEIHRYDSSSIDDRFSYWSFSPTAIVVEEDYQLAMKSSSIASYMNWPLLYPDEINQLSNINGLKEVLIGMELFMKMNVADMEQII